MPRTALRLFTRGSQSESSRVADVLRSETTGGALLMIAAVIAIVWANTAFASTYESLRAFTVGPAALHLDLSLNVWAADGLLAIFFFVAGLELKREFVAGDLRDPRRAALPVAAAVGGMALPALLYALVNAFGDGDTGGWAIPTATDIVFAVAVLAVLGSHLPSALRTFLLTLAVVDDLIAITIIAVFYTESLQPLWLLAAVVPIGFFAVLVQRRVHTPLALVPLALVAWGCVHESGVHATVAGVLLGFCVPVLRRDGASDKPGLAEYLEHRVRPLSTGLAVPVFAFFAAGVHVGGWSGLGSAITDPIAIGIVAGLVLGKTVGISLSAWVLARFTRADLDDELAWPDVIGMAALAGIGFTVSLLIGELAFGANSTADEHVKVGVLLGSVVAGLVAAVILRTRNRAYRQTSG